MGYNSISETSPTGTTLTQNTSYNPLVWNRPQSNFQQNFNHEAVYGGHYPSDPFRPGEYMQNWSGFTQYQTWDSLGGMFSGVNDYPTRYRAYVTGGNANDTVILLLSRNQPMQYAPAPIAISQYALATQQVYIGSDFSGGMYG